MDNIDILEEKIKIIESLCTDDCINKETVIKPFKYAISNLISENKELKEENEGLKTKLDTLIEKYKELKEELDSVKQIYYTQREIEENYILKSKVEETIQTMNTNILNAEKFDCDYIGQCRFAKYVLQSLLGKE